MATQLVLELLYEGLTSTENVNPSVRNRRIRDAQDLSNLAASSAHLLLHMAKAVRRRTASYLSCDFAATRCRQGAKCN